MDNLPKDFKPGVDYSFFISEKEPSKWIETEKLSVKEKIVANSVGSFRNDLRKLRLLRKEMRPKILESDCKLIDKNLTDEHLISNISSVATNSFVDAEQMFFEDIITKSIGTSSNSKPFTKPSTPSNPLIDQTVKIIKPTEWIDCISRESKRVFVKDNWIVARILLPPVSKDSIGLKRLTLE